MTGQFNRVDVTVLPMGWTNRETGSFPSEVSGSWSPALSPDGRHAAYVSDRSGRPQVWVQPVGSELTFLVDTGEAPVAAVQWSTGGGWLACLVAPGGAPRHEVWLVRPDGSELHQVGGFSDGTADNVRWLPGRSLLALTENLTTALLIDAVSGERSVVARGELISLLDVSPGRDRALLRVGPRGDRHIVVRDLLTGVDEFVTAGEQAVFGPDGETVYARTESGELPALIRVAKGGVEVLAASETDEVESFTITADGRTAAVLWNVRGGLSELTLIDLDSGARRPVTPLPGWVVSGPSWSFDGSALAFTAEGPGQPHGVWVSSATGVEAVSAEAAAPNAVRPTLETFAAHDGLTLTGWLFRPAGDGPHPTVLWFHGGPEAQERPGHGPLFQSLTDRGIAVFAPNVRGSSGFGRSFVNADNLGLRYAAIEDVRSCARYLTGSGVASTLGIMGRSYGGYLTLAALTTFPGLFAVGIDVCGMSNFATFYEHTEPWIAAAAVSKYGDPVTDRELLADLSPITRIDRLRTPLMIVHGENDSNVPVIEAEQVVRALEARGVPHRYLLFPGEGHELLHRSSRADYLRETVDWLTTYL
ncbi:S9 family peptidase [Paractinoplanes hotanensis]|uniref:S9 family peptidase n=1 Tax=Paractinoplanes hotanensis TaxID=2906497 RepID=A0ABT0XXZ7_9ACTN|nr:S9 family peptidase [Actinoplanes hotanensis]MCM4078470.1 S9 family peptidase [Actinoplanes hotanensis]